MPEDAERPARYWALEPWDGGSHRAFWQSLQRHVPGDWRYLGMPARHWKWRMRGSALAFAARLGPVAEPPPDVLLASSYLPLAELGGLRPELAAVPSLLSFHENQFAYPERAAWSGPRDVQYRFSQVVSAAAATGVVFHSEWNRRSFLAGAEELLRRLPDGVPADLLERIEAKSTVLGLPLEFPVLAEDPARSGGRERGPVLLWNHRWEHDKDPDRFFAALHSLAADGLPFRLAVCGVRYTEAPAVFSSAEEAFADRIVHWGPIDDAAEYWRLLGRCHVVVSTAQHEFFGVSVLEAVHAGCCPVVPDALSYPELFPARYRYGPEGDGLERMLAARIRSWIEGRDGLRRPRPELCDPHRAERRAPAYGELLDGLRYRSRSRS